jgi:hypothetical protein
MALEVKTAKNSKLPKLSENYFEPVGKGGWPLFLDIHLDQFSPLIRDPIGPKPFLHIRDSIGPRPSPSRCTCLTTIEYILPFYLMPIHIT